MLRPGEVGGALHRAGVSRGRQDRQDERGAEPVMRMGLLRLPEDKVLQNVNVIDRL